MTINGKNVTFRFTVGASADIARMCPDGNIGKIADAIATTDTAKQIDFIVGMAVAMSKYGGGDKLTRDDVYSLEFNELRELQEELMRTYKGDSRTSVATEAVRTKKKDADGAQDD